MWWTRDLQRVQTRQDELFRRQEEMAAVLSRIETEWADTKDQVRRSYQRLERATQRAATHSAPPDPTNDVDQAAQERTDPYSKKLAQIRSQQRDLSPGVDETAG